MAATVLGSMVIEKHFTLDVNRKSFDHKISLDAKNFKEMIENIKLFKSMLGSKIEWVSNLESKNKKWMRRIIISKNNLPINHKISEDDILFMRPAKGINGLSPKDFYKVIGKVVKTNISKNTPIKLDRLYD